MPNESGHLYLFEAMELRHDYDRHIKALETIVGAKSKHDRLFSTREEEDDREPADDVDLTVLQQTLKAMQSKRVKLNQAIQKANFNYEIDYEGDKISLAEALEVRKALLSDHETLSQRLSSSAYKRIVHKEERDIVRASKYPFHITYPEFQTALKKLRQLLIQIHQANHRQTVDFRDE